MFTLLFALALQQTPPASVDSDTKAWWRTTVLLSGDGMEGRDPSSKGYDRAAEMVAQRFAAAGIKPLGDSGTWFQSMPMEETAITRASVEVGGRKLDPLRDFYAPVQGTPASLDAAVAYRGYCGADALGDVTGKLVICHATRRAGLPNDAARVAALTKAGALGMIAIADPGFSVEPPRWPFAYMRSVRLAGSPAPAPRAIVYLLLNAAALEKVIAGSGRDAAALVAAGSRGDSLPSFEVPGNLKATFETAQKTYRSSNVVGILAGTDPSKSREAIVLTAHLDGYGYGEPVKGDSLYNGTLDDAAYVALMIQLAERLKGKGYARPLIFVALTGEEKGLLGSNWFTAHLPVPKQEIAANINLDQLRPLFPLELLTVHALEETSLGDDARAVATSLGITVQNDPEPERNLLMRSDHWTFIRAGIPAINFVFGFKPGSESERIYRQWYREGYHTPQDDTNQKIDWKAAGLFNRFYYGLVERVAGQETTPSWKPGSKLRPTT
ncbi:MAG TPA: M28 family peptidase [Gemmatimonadales bacterium]|nr:M28 family peptidase [Gemmatimonadales bacterium]